MLAKELITRVSASLLDAGMTRWTESDLFGYLTDAQRMLINLRPDARAVTESVKLTAKSTRQSIPTGGYKLLDIVRNMGADGQTPGYPVTITTRDALDDSNIGWHTDDPAEEIDHFVFDDANPTVFYVTPPPDSSVYVEVVYSKAPDPVESMDDVVAVDESFSETLREYMLYLAFGMDHSDPADRSKASTHLGNFYLSIGEESKAKAAFSPNREIHYNGQAGA